MRGYACSELEDHLCMMAGDGGSMGPTRHWTGPDRLCCSDMGTRLIRCSNRGGHWSSSIPLDVYRQHPLRGLPPLVRNCEVEIQRSFTGNEVLCILCVVPLQHGDQ